MFKEVDYSYKCKLETKPYDQFEILMPSDEYGECYDPVLLIKKSNGDVGYLSYFREIFFQVSTTISGVMSLGRSLDIRIINLYDKKVPIDGIVFSYIINAVIANYGSTCPICGRVHKVSQGFFTVNIVNKFPVFCCLSCNEMIELSKTVEIEGISDMLSLDPVTVKTDFFTKEVKVTYLARTIQYNLCKENVNAYGINVDPYK